jgi:dihydrofolate reductase
MSKVRFHLGTSLDGYVAGINQSLEEPFGHGGMRILDWLYPLAIFSDGHGDGGTEVNASTAVVQEWQGNVGAHIMGRNMFGRGQNYGRGEWDESWTGWWGEEPPYHTPVYVLTHHPREPLTMKGGTTFHFVTDGIDSALEQAREAAQDKDILIAGGASCVRQYLAAGHIDEFVLSLVPLVLGAGERFFEGLDPAQLRLEQICSVEAPGVTHLKYRLLK